MIGVSVEFNSLAQVAIGEDWGFREVFWGAKIVPKVTSNHSASWIGFKEAVSDFTFLMANSSCLGSANLLSVALAGKS